MLFGLFDDLSTDKQFDFDKFYEEYFLYVFDLVKIRIDSTEDSEDISADIFADLWKKREKLSRVTKMKGYLKKIVANSCADYYEKKKRKNTVSISEDTVTYEDFSEDYEETAKQIISMLSEKDKELYEEVHIHKKSLKQISEEKRIKYDTLKRRYLRLKEKVIIIMRKLL